MPVDHVSNQVDDAVLDWLECLPGYSLNVGAGATRRRPPRCVELEHSVFVNTSVVGDAHELPFADDTFDAVVSYNTFEHLAEPAAAAKEIYRVLKPGGSLRLQTAFLQPLHEEPAHFYNATEYGLRRWFSDFDIIDCFVAPATSPSKMLAWLSHHVLYYVSQTEGPEVQEMLGSMKLSQWALFWSEPTTRVGFIPVLFNRLPVHIRPRFSAGHELRARKRRFRAADH
jgi:SAM-dependent methyltransferase